MKTLWKSLILMSLIAITTPFEAFGFQANDDIDQKVLGLKGQDMLPLHQKALAGDAQAQYMLGRAMQIGWNIAKDLPAAADWYRKAADQGYAPAQLKLFEVYSEGEGLSKNLSTALKWLHKAAEGGLASAQFSLGLNLEGQGKFPDAAKWFRKAAEQGFASAQTAIGFLHEQGQGVSRDLKQAVSWYRKAAEQGDATAQSNLGNMYSLGQGVKKDPAEAAKWFLKSAEQGWGDGQLNLAGLYMLGEGVPRDFASAYMWVSIAAVNENTTAKATCKEAIQVLETKMPQQLIAEGRRRAADWIKSHASSTKYEKAGNSLFIKSEAVPDDVAAEIKNTQSAAEQGDLHAQSVLGEFYYRAQRYEEAVAWFRKSADQGYDYGQYNLGVAYMEGSGVPRDYAEANKWFRKAAEQGLGSAMNNLAAAYYNGKGVAKDLSATYMWTSLAAAAGEEMATQNIKPLKQMLTPAELAEAERRIAEWQAQHAKHPK